MTTPKMLRCKDCAYLAVAKNGEWVCLDCIDKSGNSKELNIEDIDDKDCSMNKKW